jgi:hypothetical protein
MFDNYKALEAQPLCFSLIFNNDKYSLDVGGEQSLQQTPQEEVDR